MFPAGEGGRHDPTRSGHGKVAGASHRHKKLGPSPLERSDVPCLAEPVEGMTRPASNRPRRRILFLVTEDWYFCSHRLELVRRLIRKGWDVHVACSVRSHGGKIRREGIRLHAVDFTRSSLSPLRVLGTIRDLRRVMQNEKPDLIVAVALRPILLAPWARGGRPIPVVNLVTGMGSLFSGSSHAWGANLLGRWVKLWLHHALVRPGAVVVVQNGFDRRLLAGWLGCPLSRIHLIHGTGVESASKVFRKRRKEDPFRLLYAGRLLYDKGVGELIEAFRSLRQNGFPIRLEVLGEADPANPAKVPADVLKDWKRIPGLRFLGRKEPGEVRRRMAQADCLVFPSYREGLPRVILEAGLCRLPVVASSIPGVREIIRHRRHGLLVPPRQPVKLARALTWMIRNPAARERMGNALQKTVQLRFSPEAVCGRLESVLGSSLPHRRSRA